MRTEIGDREGEATNYGNIGTVFKLLGQYDKAEEYLQKALKNISKKRLLSQLKLATDQRKHHVMET